MLRSIVLIGLVIVVFALNLALGSVRLPLHDIVALFTGAPMQRETSRTILLLFRLPKALTAVFAGAALALAGLSMQTLFRNPLAGPFILGINSGAGLGVALVVLAVGGSAQGGLTAGVSSPGEFGIALSAGIGAAAVLLLVLAVSRRVQSVMTLLILGLLFGYGVNAITTILINFSPAEQVQSYISWSFGSFGGVTWPQFWILAGSIAAGTALIAGTSKQLNAFLLGELYAQSMGVSLRPVRAVLIVATALLAGAVTAFCGPIGFLGIAMPHLARALFRTADHRILIPSSALLGMIAALTADLVSGLPGSQIILPLNAVTSLIGVPVVAWVILRRRNLRQVFGS
jgi:iron complex transport system permease protein